MEFESLVRRSTLAMKTLRGTLAATVVLATTFLAAPAWAQATPETAAQAAPATAAAAAPATGAAAEEAGMSPTAIRNVAIIIALFVVIVVVGVSYLVRVPFTGFMRAIREPFLIALSTSSSASEG